MRIFVAGATGAMGRELLPQLRARGHDVVGMTRSPQKAEAVRALGAEPALADGLDAAAVAEAVAGARPDVIVHQLTALSSMGDNLRHFDRDFAPTNRLRTEGTDHLLAAAHQAGVRRFVAQSFAGWPYAREGGPVKDEEARLDPDPPAAARETLAAIRHLEEATLNAPGIEGMALRYGGFYGAGTSLGEGGVHVEAVRRRRFPIVGDGAGVWSLVHIHDAASATVAAVEGGAPGIYNVADDEPAPVAEWLPVLAEAVGAPPPRRLPRWLGHVAGGSFAVAMMTEIRGAANGKARRELCWDPRWPTWREGFRGGLGVAAT